MTTKVQLLADNSRLSTENTVLSCTLNDILNGDVKWFGNSCEYSLGITRPRSACGGMVVIRCCGTSSARYWEQFAREELTHISFVITGENTEHNRELLRRRSAIEAAQAYVSQQLKAA